MTTEHIIGLLFLSFAGLMIFIAVQIARGKIKIGD